MKSLSVSCSPHIRDNSWTRAIMMDVLIALVPALVASVLVFGFRALAVVAVCVVCAVGSEWLFELGVKRPVTVGDLSAAVTGTLLAFCLPVSIPLWIAGLGSVIAIVVVKQLFGGIGENFANPAVTGRVILLVAFSSQMANWTVDGVSSATPLAAISAGGEVPGLMDMFLGLRAGSLGETCGLALLLGGLYLLARRIITWQIPVAYLGTVILFALAAQQSVPYQLMGGGLLLGAFFMATDYSTSPVTGLGKLIYGIGCGLLTMMIRTWGGYPEGVSFAILLMNIVTPHIDRLTRTMPLGGDLA
ncbi:MAG TPA: RnfABCDGE type electron transport complex subunit D [Pseudoflavonifractor sp.]|nr:RnfABCDGE type electron transport complex subunit D [Pseudoflavonifractor sp.]